MSALVADAGIAVDALNIRLASRVIVQRRGRQPEPYNYRERRSNHAAYDHQYFFKLKGHRSVSVTGSAMEASIE